MTHDTDLPFPFLSVCLGVTMWHVSERMHTPWIGVLSGLGPETNRYATKRQERTKRSTSDWT